MNANLETRVLLATATARDGEVTRSLLAAEGLDCTICENLYQLVAELGSGVGAILLTEDAFAAEGLDELLARLAMQPPWSDIPVVVLMRGDRSSPVAARVLGSLRNVTLLERPAPTRSVISAVQAAVRGRERQYQICAQIEDRERLLANERAARADAEHAGRLKDQFLATVSHELRTPLNAILGWSQILRSHNRGDEELDEGLSVIERNARVQAQLIEDLLDMSRIISGKLRLDVQQVDVADITNAAIESVRPAADAREIRLQKVLDSQVGPVRGDPARLQQVVWNLLTNAIKFTPKGGKVQVALQLVNSHVEISVTDTGMGIKSEFLPYVFERFRQADATTTRRHGGLGLGLAIVKNLVELHGGTVRAISRGEGAGATFIVELPLMVMHENDSRRENPRRSFSTEVSDFLCESAALRGITVLVVDDEEDARRLIMRVLEECKAKVVVAASVAEAIEVFKRERPDVVVSDIGMPNQDGYDFIRRVRALSESQGGKTPAAALTAFARSEDRTRALRAGYQSHISKPVEPAELVAVIASLAGRIGSKDPIEQTR